ncbi:hypothetical protein C1645_811582 [Glomus cerebriforme]|uniref:G-protein coupled receptors family 1 profile domain-containing protein n=1 Tax=Glomus cerebriforme TaxID=658196 RepID=A0A397TWV5_9GLOM|nr:hypothetical protein C1645_811582 [Glomus cerebriforme]
MQSQTSLSGNRFTLNTESTISLILTSINFVSCLYVLSRLYFIRRRKDVEIKYPFCFAISYLICSILQIANIFINHSTLSQSGIFYKIFGKFYPVSLTINLLLVGFLEFSTMSKLIEKIDVESGKYDVYMWQGMFLLSWVTSIFGINRYEQLELKYAFNFNTVFKHHFNVFLIFIVIMSATSYFLDLRKILRKVISQELLCKNRDNINPNFIRACLFSILPFLFQWSLILFYNIIKVIGNNNDVNLNVLLIIAVNIGGIGHAISYFIYERKYLSTNPSNDPIEPIDPIIFSYGALP